MSCEAEPSRGKSFNYNTLYLELQMSNLATTGSVSCCVELSTMYGQLGISLDSIQLANSTVGWLII